MTSFILFFTCIDELIIFYFLKYFIYLFLEGEGRERGKCQCVVVSQVPPIGNLAHHPRMCPDWESKQQPMVGRWTLIPLSHTSQRCTY